MASKAIELIAESSKLTQRINELRSAEERSAEETSELDKNTSRWNEAQVELRAAVAMENEKAETHQHEGGDAEHRERVELRSKAKLGNYLVSALRGRALTGAEAELAAAARVDGIPLELWDTEKRADIVTGAPGTTGVNLDTIRPQVFANTIASKLGVDMPRVESGTYATATISTGLSASARVKSAVQDSTAAAFTVSTASPKSISARLSVTLEDIAAVGTDSFESALRENLALVLSNELDNQAINGDGSAPNLSGIFQALDDPTAAPTAIADLRRLRRCSRGRHRRTVGEHPQGRDDCLRARDLREGSLDVPDREQLQRRVERSRLRHGEHGRTVDEQADARRRHLHGRGQCPASHLVPDVSVVPQHGRRLLAHGNLPPLECGQHR